MYRRRIIVVCFIVLIGSSILFYRPIRTIVFGILSNVVLSISSYESEPQTVWGAKIVNQARQQIGRVIAYDAWYYAHWYPPPDRGACTDVIVRTLEELWYPFKEKFDADIVSHQTVYGVTDIDPNIDFRRVRLVKIFLERHTQSLSTDTTDFTHRQAGDIVTYDQIPWRLWHIAIVSSRKTRDGRPLLIHNHGFGTTENDLLTKWPAKISGHYRVTNLLDNV